MSDDTQIGGNSAKALQGLLERVERLEEEKANLQSDIKDIKAEAKGQGFDMKGFNEMLRLRKMDAEKRQEQEAIRDMYMNALDLI